MTSYSFTAEQRAAFRKAITASPAWDLYRTVNNVSASAMGIDDMLKAAQELNINPADYGTVKGQPKPRPYGPYITAKLGESFADITRYLIPQDTEKGHNILFTVNHKQAGCMTQGQYDALSRIIAAGEAVRDGKPMPAPVPMQEAESDEGDDDAERAFEALRKALEAKKGGISESRVLELIASHAARPAHITVNLITPQGHRLQEGALMHHKTPLLLSAVSAGVNVMMVGPAGSGKTTAAHEAAKALGVPFYLTGAIDSAYKLTGFIDAQGRLVRTAFREAFEHGGVFLFDEMDSSMPAALLAFNAALANGHADFPDGIIERHPDFRAIAACNTFGGGANRQYVGRMQLDAASLDRFATLTWDYCPALEAALIGAPAPDDAPRPKNIKPLESQEAAQAHAINWHQRVLKARAKADAQKIRCVISPRATIMGAKLLAAGWALPEVEESVLFKGLDAESRAKIEG